jgi:transketolase N-terminal domain/subunit
MREMEQLELDAHRKDIIRDMHVLLEKYRAIFGWDIPEIDQQGADKLILAAMHKALDDLSK